MARAVARSSRAAALPQWIPPQLTQLVDTAPDGDHWLHEIKYDGYRMHARLSRWRAVRRAPRRHKLFSMPRSVSFVTADQGPADMIWLDRTPIEAALEQSPTEAENTKILRRRWSSGNSHGHLPTMSRSNSMSAMRPGNRFFKTSLRRSKTLR
jgi:hypothetical protein